MKRLCAWALGITVMFCGAAAADADSASEPVKTVLIASGQSMLELAVIGYLTDKLAAAGVAVKSVKLDDFPKMPLDSFGAVVVMNAVDKDKLRNSVKNYLNSYNPDQQATVIIATVTGEQWKEKESVVDAVTQASTTLEPKRIAEKLYTRVATILKL